jgi:hypothetical protein
MHRYRPTKSQGNRTTLYPKVPLSMSSRATVCRVIARQLQLWQKKELQVLALLEDFSRIYDLQGLVLGELGHSGQNSRSPGWKSSAGRGQFRQCDKRELYVSKKVQKCRFAGTDPGWSDPRLLCRALRSIPSTPAIYAMRLMIPLTLMKEEEASQAITGTRKSAKFPRSKRNTMQTARCRLSARCPHFASMRSWKKRLRRSPEHSSTVVF